MQLASKEQAQIRKLHRFGRCQNGIPSMHWKTFVDAINTGHPGMPVFKISPEHSSVARRKWARAGLASILERRLCRGGGFGTAGGAWHLAGRIPNALGQACGQRDQTAPSGAIQSPSLAIVGQSAACNLKGNISRKGERIYHIPGQKYYDRTKISKSKGECWYCSGDETWATGWRKAQR